MIRAFFKGFKEGFHAFGQGVATIVNTVLLTVVYFVGVGPTSLIARLTGKKFLNLGDEFDDSYWIKKDTGKPKEEELYRQF